MAACRRPATRFVIEILAYKRRGCALHTKPSTHSFSNHDPTIETHTTTTPHPSTRTHTHTHTRCWPPLRIPFQVPPPIDRPSQASPLIHTWGVRALFAMWFGAVCVCVRAANKQVGHLPRPSQFCVLADAHKIAARAAMLARLLNHTSRPPPSP